MSELTQCNFCDFQAIKRNAPKGHRVTVLPDADFGLGGVNVYVHPRSVAIAKLPGGEDGPRSKYRRAWFMNLPEHCCC